MDILTSSAKFLNNSLCDLAMDDMPHKLNCRNFYTTGADIFNAKVHIFNNCTIALIAWVAFGVFGLIAPANAIFLGACSLFGRKVTDESFNVVLPSCVRRFLAPDAMKPKRWLSYGETVIFYDPIPRNLLD